MVYTLCDNLYYTQAGVIWAQESNLSDIPTAIIKYHLQYFIIKPVFCGTKKAYVSEFYRSKFLHVMIARISNLNEIKGEIRRDIQIFLKISPVSLLRMRRFVLPWQNILKKSSFLYTCFTNKNQHLRHTVIAWWECRAPRKLGLLLTSPPIML